MTHKKEGAIKTILGLYPRHRAIAKALSPTLVGGVEDALDGMKVLIDAATAGDESAADWLAKMGIESGVATNGTAIVIRKDGTIGAWIV